MDVVKDLASYRQRKAGADPESIALLRHLERLASAGRLRDLDVRFRIDGNELRACTGSYETPALRPAKRSR